MPTGNSQNLGSIEFTANVSPEERNFFNALLGGLPADMRVVKFEKAKLAPPDNGIKVLFNNPATILWVNGKKIVSKAHNEEFDEEKGLLMCLAKAHGISHREIQRMLKSAQRQTKKVKTAITEEEI